MAFNLKVHHRDQKSGKIVSSDPYRLHCSADKGWLFERPPGSGKFYYEDGNLAKDESKAAIEKEEKHVEVEASAPAVAEEAPAEAKAEAKHEAKHETKHHEAKKGSSNKSFF